jgi:hypothetical protein
MSDFKLTTPVALIIFNRPDTTERVFSEIARAQPPKLLVVGDGPRANRAGEAEKVAATRAIIERVDWPCEVLTNFSEINLGCKRRVSSGIDWVFSQVGEAILLEDDCLPHPTFFRFCQEMLERYRSDQRIGMVSGSNFQFGRKYGEDSYYFSQFTHIWGWASWRDRWQDSYDVNMSKWLAVCEEGRVADLFGDAREAAYGAGAFQLTYQGQIDTWDYQWSFANRLNGRLSVMPMVNLISNIGFGADATRPPGPTVNLPTVAMEFPLVHPFLRVRNKTADTYFEKRFLRTPFWRRGYRKLARVVRDTLNRH